MQVQTSLAYCDICDKPYLVKDEKEEFMNPAVLLLFVPLIGVYCWFHFLARVTIYEFQKGLLYKKGAFIKLLGVGKHRYLRANSMIQVVDIRKNLMAIAGQEVLTKDNVNIKITLTGVYEISDPIKAVHSSANYVAELYNLAQIALRDLVGTVTIDELLEKKSDIDAQLLAKITEQGKELGLNVTILAVKDIMLPANLKRAFSGILEAKKEAQKQLENARGEQAVLRNLANSSAMYENNQYLLQARIIQSLSNGNNSIVFNADDKIIIQKKT